MDVVLVVAMDRDGFIGQDGGLPWHLPADLRRFKALTFGHPVVMGRRTCDSLPRPLPGRKNIVLTRRRDFARDGFFAAHAVDEVLALAAPAPQVMVLGGAAIYALFLPRATRFELTLVDAHVGGDTKFPAWDPAAWREIAREDHPADDRNRFPLVFRTLVRRNP